MSPDLTTAYAGRFVEGRMVAGRVVNVTGYRLSDDVIVPELSEPADDATVYRYRKLLISSIHSTMLFLISWLSL